MEKLGDRIKILMIKNNRYQRELAEMIGVSECAISRYVNNLRLPTIPVLAKIAIALNTSTDYLIGIK